MALARFKWIARRAPAPGAEAPGTSEGGFSLVEAMIVSTSEKPPSLVPGASAPGAGARLAIHLNLAKAIHHDVFGFPFSGQRDRHARIAGCRPRIAGVGIDVR